MFTLTPYESNESADSWQKDPKAVKIMGTSIRNITSCPVMLAAMSREMRTQMNAVVSFAYLLNKKEYKESEREEFSNMIYDSCEQIISLFDNFLDAAIIDAQIPAVKPKPCDTELMFADLYSEFRKMLKKDKFKDIVLVTESQSFKESKYLFDVNIVSRIVRCLFQNALCNTKSGYIKAGYYIRNDNLTFFILDSGQGYNKSKEFIQNQDLSQSLAKFNDVYSAVNLSLTKKLIQFLNGSFWIECNGLTGSGIYFTIPITIVKSENSADNYMSTMITI